MEPALPPRKSNTLRPVEQFSCKENPPEPTSAVTRSISQSKFCQFGPEKLTLKATPNGAPTARGRAGRVPPRGQALISLATGLLDNSNGVPPGARRYLVESSPGRNRITEK